MTDLFRRPVNQTAFMQHLQRLVSTGHVYWCADVIPQDRLPAFAEKWSSFGLAADIPARAYRKRSGKASVHLCLAPMSFDDQDKVLWWMLSTEGAQGLGNSDRVPGRVKDCRLAEARIVFGHYELLQLPRSASAEKSGPVSWTWRLSASRYREWEALLVERIKARDTDGLKEAAACLVAMPMFAGVREQVKRLFDERDKVAGKFKLRLPAAPKLPVMRMIKLWPEMP
jgi:hypothetical protein